MVLYSGVSLKCIFYKTKAVQTRGELSIDSSHWHMEAKPALQKINPLINLPYIEVYDEDQKILVAQSIACMNLLARVLDMQGSDKHEHSHCEQLLCEIMDVRNKMVQFAYSRHSNHREAAANLFESTMVIDSGHFKKIEIWLKSRNASPENPYLVGNNATAPDFALFEMLDQYAELIRFFELIPCKSEQKVDILEARGKSNLANHYGHFRDSPKLQSYFQSQLNNLPFNEKRASFGSGNGGDRWNAELDEDTTPEVIRLN